MSDVLAAVLAELDEALDAWERDVLAHVNDVDRVGADARVAKARRELSDQELVRLWTGLRDKLTPQQLVALAGGTVKAEELFAQLYAGVTDALGDQLAASAVGFAATELEELRLVLSFDLVNPRAVAWAQTAAGDLITRVTAEQVDVVRDTVAQGIARGAHPRRLAREIGDTVGLRPDQVRALAKYRAGLEASGTTPGRVDDLAERYSRRLLRQRGELIARTETIAARTAGQREAWDVAFENGLLDVSGATREWVAALDSRTDVICEGLDGTEVAYGEEFPYGDPPVHPDCRCRVGLRFHRDVEKRSLARPGDQTSRWLVRV